MALLKFHTTSASRPVEKRQAACAFGMEGEQIAATYLTDKGYTILEHNYRRGHLEIDLIALDRGELVIVEVKTRASDDFMQPEQAVDHKKRAALIRLANEFVRTHNRKENVRMDIVSIVKNDKETRIKHIENAFNAMNY